MIALVDQTHQQINKILMFALEEANDSLVYLIVQSYHPTITCSMPNSIHDMELRGLCSDAY